MPVSNNGCCGDNTYYNLAKKVPSPKAVHTAAKADGCMACVSVSARAGPPHHHPHVPAHTHTHTCTRAHARLINTYPILKYTHYLYY